VITGERLGAVTLILLAIPSFAGLYTEVLLPSMSLSLLSVGFILK